MYNTIIVLVVCGTVHKLYERGEGSEALFLTVFALTQLLVDARTRLSCRVFLPSLAIGLLLVQYGRQKETDPIRKLAEGHRNKGKKANIISKKMLWPWYAKMKEEKEASVHGGRSRWGTVRGTACDAGEV